jgi:hypothetical protein
MPQPGAAKLESAAVAMLMPNDDALAAAARPKTVSAAPAMANVLKGIIVIPLGPVDKTQRGKFHANRRSGYFFSGFGRVAEEDCQPRRPRQMTGIGGPDGGAAARRNGL